jgi:hypothetical protein
MAFAFIDDSGSGGDSPYYVLAGYAASESTWMVFDEDWRRVLALTPPMKYFKMSEAESLKGQFLGFGADERNARLALFIDVILRHQLMECSIAVLDEDFREAFYPLLPSSHSSPYYIAFIAVVSSFSGRYHWLGSEEVVDFIFDEQEGFETKAYRLYNRLETWFPNRRFGGVRFANDKVVLPLQAADLIAWQIRRFRCFPTEPRRNELARLHSIHQPFQTILRRRDLKNEADAIQLAEDVGRLSPRRRLRRQ